MGGGDIRAELESKNVLFVLSQRRLRRRSSEVTKGHMIPHLLV